jgi:hypothetical protein
LRKAEALASDDTPNCYNIIVHLVLSSFFIKWAWEETPSNQPFSFYNTEIFQKTALRDSTNSYRATIHLPLQGVIQGNGVASPGWSFVKDAG